MLMSDIKPQRFILIEWFKNPRIWLWPFNMITAIHPLFKIALKCNVDASFKQAVLSIRTYWNYFNVIVVVGKKWNSIWQNVWEDFRCHHKVTFPLFVMRTLKEAAWVSE